MARVLVAFLFAVLSLPAGAGETDWHDMGEGSRIRLVTADAGDRDGLFWAALEIELAAGSKTYWRVPGESGIPITLTPRRNGAPIPVATIDWPLPTRETVGGVMDYTYHDHLVLPFALAGLADGDRLDLDVRMGLCTQVCIPVEVAFDHTIALDGPDFPQSLRIEQARALAPIPYPGTVASAAHIDEEHGVLRLEGLAPEIEIGSLIAEIEDSPVLFDAPQATGAGALAFAPLARIGAGALEGGEAQTLRLTFSTPQGAFVAHMPL